LQKWLSLRAYVRSNGPLWRRQQRVRFMWAVTLKLFVGKVK